MFAVAESLAGQPALRTRNQQMTPTNKRGLSRPRFEDSQQHLVYGIKTKKAALTRRLRSTYEFPDAPTLTGKPARCSSSDNSEVGDVG